MNKPRTILFVHSSDEMYGSDLVLLQLVENLEPGLFRPVVVIPNDIPYEGLLSRELEARGIKIYHRKTAILRRMYFTPAGLILYLWRLLTSTFSIWKIIRSEQAALVHTNTLAVIPGALAARMAGKPHIWHVHEIILRPRLLWKLTSWLAPILSDQVVAVSNAVKDHLVSGNNRNTQKCIVIHNGLDLTRFDTKDPSGETVREEWGVSRDDILVGMIGRISHWKGQGYFLEAASQAYSQNHNLIFAMIGGVSPGQESLLQDIKDLVDRLGLSKRVIINDFRKDVPDVLSAFDIFVIPSTLPDPHPMVVLEAMAARKPVVANAHGGPLETVENGQTGFLVPPGQPQLMAEGILKLASDASSRKQMGEQGRLRLEHTFSLRAFVNKWADCYNNALSNLKDNNHQ